LYGAFAGFAATAAMTSFMARLHRRLPADQRYPLPPREITGIVAGEQVGRPREGTADLAMAAHFAFGAAAGALAAGLHVPPDPWPAP
jgi:hypothetical protein